jgi:hypothetical protein
VFVPGQGALPEFEVDARDAHAWPELYFQGLGWVPFEPTPSRGVVPAYAQDPSSGGSSTNEGNSDGLLPTSGAVPPPVTPPAPLPLPEGGEAQAGNPSLVVVYGAAGLLGLLLIAASPRLVRTTVRSRRLRAGDAGQGPAPAPLAWSELQDLATDYGVPPLPSETPRAFSARLRSFLALRRTAKARVAEAPARAVPGQTAAEAQSSAERAAGAAVQDLTAAYERHEYGRPGAAPTAASGGSGAENAGADNIAAVRKVLRRNAGVLGRLRAEWLPPSVMARWGHTAGTPFRAVRRAAARAGRAVAGSWTGARDGLRRLRDG